MLYACRVSSFFPQNGKYQGLKLKYNFILRSTVNQREQNMLTDFEAHAACLHIWYFFLNVVNNEEQNYFFQLNHFILIIFFKETCTVECIHVVCRSSFSLKVLNIDY